MKISAMKAPYNTDAFYWEHPQFKQGSFDQFDPDHVKVGEEEFFHGGAGRHRIANQPKAPLRCAKSRTEPSAPTGSRFRFRPFGKMILATYRGTATGIIDL